MRTAPFDSARRAAAARILQACVTLPIGVLATDSARAQPMPPEARLLGNAVRLQGQMRFRYWGFHVYDAQLFVLPGFDPARPLSQPLALSLTYARALDAQDIATRSLQEIARQVSVSDIQSNRWMLLLRRVLKNVTPGDRLTGVYRPDAPTAFFHNGEPTGEFSDAELATLFFGIWLAPQTSQPALRRALLALPDGDRAAR